MAAAQKRTVSLPAAQAGYIDALVADPSRGIAAADVLRRLQARHAGRVKTRPVA